MLNLQLFKGLTEFLPHYKKPVVPYKQGIPVQHGLIDILNITSREIKVKM